ncbi:MULTISPECIES: PD-(D/E)XK nuclease family protein [unclassified Pseudomonas]|uniref:PD-(D/E)XK nuclease family protein n=1 Tax=unclassified Pseudomonas TaxID=196821 RepID=UPI000D8D78A8|nr:MULTISPECIES: PD-(D/E)XK nuclease family protein [unclassified Pseudomonas]PYG78461.1 PD-(D/E)XK nuclease superfamily protein [Pseudomonas sp. RV120224-01c]PYG82597.1 PD-(D/E)XK nuclease superfamily protein [Pseudomonas sp. RV120224-01b]
MHITFGLFLDARQGPSPTNFFNNPIVGRLGFLSLLETYLGLSAPEASTARRVAIYSGLLQAHDNDSRFYSDSLKVDSIGTAARLLAWRDEWRLGGWDGSANPEHPPRIQELAVVEKAALEDLPPGEAERLHLVIKALSASGPGPIRSVHLVDPLEDFPHLWQQVLERLPKVEVRLPEPQGAGQLRAVQEQALAVLNGGSAGDFAVQTDGSILLVHTLAATTAEHWLGTQHVHTPADRLILAEDAGDSLDVSLSVAGSVNCGFERPSQLRPALQALALALELCWDPVDMNRLLDFLTHPVGPFSRAARGRLARAVANQPGIGGEAWTTAKNKIAEGDDAQEVADEITFWLESKRWARTDGVPVDALIARVDRMQEAMRRRLSGESADAAIFIAAHSQCAAVHDALIELARQGVSKLLPRQVEQLVAHATPAGATNPAAVPHIGCMRSSGTAAACIEAADEVIWWMPSTPALPSPLPWSPAEVNALTELGVQLRDPARELVSLALRWLRPLLAARNRFVIVCPPPGSEVHPIRQLLKKLVPDIEPASLDLDAALNSTLLGVTAEVLAPQALPATPRHIQLPHPVQLGDTLQSFTTLNELFNDAALFVLKRVAKLDPSSVLEVDEGNRLLGILAHRVLEKLFAHDKALSWSNAEAVDWFRTVADSLLMTEGAVLLMQGAGVTQQHFRQVCERAIGSLLDHLRLAGAIQVQTEVEFRGTLGAVPLIGKIDLLVTLGDKRTVAVDIKWRGDTYYAGLLRSGEHLQLALYSSLIEQASGVAPAALGYFILESGGLYISAADIFPKAQVRRPPDGVTVSNLLDRARATWEWRKQQLDAGIIEVVPEEPSDEFQGPEGTLPVNGPSKWDQDHLILLGGWK